MNPSFKLGAPAVCGKPAFKPKRARACTAASKVPEGDSVMRPRAMTESRSWPLRITVWFGVCATLPTNSSVNPAYGQVALAAAGLRSVAKITWSASPATHTTMGLAPLVAIERSVVGFDATSVAEAKLTHAKQLSPEVVCPAVEAPNLRQMSRSPLVPELRTTKPSARPETFVSSRVQPNVETRKLRNRLSRALVELT